MLIVHSALGYCVLLAIAYLSGRRTRSISWKTLGVATVLQPAIRSLVFDLASDLTTLLKKTALTANESLLFSGVSAGRSSPSKSRQFSSLWPRFTRALPLPTPALDHRPAQPVHAEVHGHQLRRDIPVKLSGTSGVIYYLAETKSR